MSALTAQRRIEGNLGEFTINLDIPIATFVVLWKGGFAAANASGYLVPAAATSGLRMAGLVAGQTNRDRYDTTAAGPDGVVADGVKSARIQLGVFPFFNSGTDPVTQADLLNDVYMVDDQTISRTDGGVGASIAGQLLRIDASPARVWVAIGFRLPDKGGPSAGAVYATQDQISASGAISLLTESTRVAVTGTTAYTLANGLYLGQPKWLRCVLAASTPVGVVTPANGNGFTSLTFNALQQSAFLRWNGAKWDLIATSGTPTIT